MSYHITLHPLALQEMEESYQWYEERLAGLGNQFIVALQKRIDKIAEMPDLHPKKKGAFREVTIKGFPFTIIYEIFEKQKVVLISYVFHTKRDPKLKYKKR